MQPSSCADALRALGFNPGELPDEEQLKQRFRRLALKHHPDKAGSQATAASATARFQEISEAYEVLKEALTEDGNLPPHSWGFYAGGETLNQDDVFSSHRWTAPDVDTGPNMPPRKKRQDAYWSDCVGRWGATEFGWRAYPRAQPGGCEPAHTEHPAFDYNRRQYFRSTQRDQQRPPPPDLSGHQEDIPAAASSSRPPPPDLSFQGWGSAPRKAEPPPKLDPQQHHGKAAPTPKQGRMPTPCPDDLLWSSGADMSQHARMPTPCPDDLLWSSAADASGKAATRPGPPEFSVQKENQATQVRKPAPDLRGYASAPVQPDSKVPLPEFQRARPYFTEEAEYSDDDLPQFLPTLGGAPPQMNGMKVPLPNF